MRYAIWFPVTLEIPEGQLWCVCRDVSSGGLMISSRTSLDAGHSVLAVFRLAPGDEECRIKATIARCMTNDDDMVLAFPFRLAVEFEQPVPALEPRLVKHSEKPPML